MMLYNPDIDLVNGNVHTKFCLILSIHVGYGARTKFLGLSRVVTVLQICEKQRFTIPTKILSIMMCIQNLASFCQFVLKTLSNKNEEDLIKNEGNRVATKC